MALELIGLALLGIVIGAYGTVIGAGGGFILVPVLLLLYPGYEPEDITSISLFVVCVNAVSGSIAYWRQRRVDLLTGVIFAACAAPGVFAGAVVVHYLPERLFTAVFGVMLIVLAAASSRRQVQAIREPLRGRGVLVRRVSDTEGRTYVYAYRVWQAAGMSLGIGFVSSLFGIGGGVMQVPVMTFLLHIPLQFATATSLFSLSFMSGGATALHLVTGTLAGDVLTRSVALAAGTVPGAQLGAVAARRIHGRHILLALASTIALLGVRLLLRAALDI